MATIRDLQLDPGGDLLVTAGDLVLVGDLPAIAQDLQQTYQFFHGEDPVAPDEGFPWFEQVLGKKPDSAVLRQVFVDYGEARPGIASIPVVNLNFDRSARKLAVSVTAKADSGELVDVATAVQVP
jgi:hypothetical protein